MTFKTITLPSGLRIITVPMQDNPSVTVLVMVRAGSKYETKDINGLSHFLEHMCFKGTERRPKASDISRELDSIGANYNAFTSMEYTGYYAKAASKHAEKVIDVISDMYLHPIFDAKELEKEKGVIVEEIRMCNDLPQRKVYYVLTSLLFGDQPAGWSIAGPEETVKSMTREQMIAYRAAHYTAPATTVIVSGSFNEKETIAQITKAFEKADTKQSASKLPVKEAQSAPAIVISYKETDQTHLIIGFRSFDVNDKRAPVMYVLMGILGGGMSSRLFSKMRDQLGICYYIKADNDSLTDHGYVSISAGVDNSRVEEGIKGILEECRRIKTESVGAEELVKVKDYISGTTLLGLETSDARAEFCGYQDAIRGSVESPDELIAKVRAVTVKDVQKLAREIFVNKGMNMALIGRYKDSESFRKYFSVD
ncbi:MAG: pitrilysin family protein [Candidatus Taylorbacteria bacterium]